MRQFQMLLWSLALAATLPEQAQAEPPLLTGAIDAPQVKALQRAWADHLSVPVEEKVDLGGDVKLVFVLVPPGKFWMGSRDREDERLGNEGPQHRVTITKPFYLGKYEVTQEQWQRVMGSNPSWFTPAAEGKDAVRGVDTRRLPVDRVSWPDAAAFVRKLSTKERTIRLPTEAEWEYACRGGACEKASQPFHFEEGPLDILSSDLANFNGDFPYGDAPRAKTLNRPAEVGSYPANRFGLHDMHGNVREWCADRYGEDYYKQTVADDPPGPATEQSFVLRGGGWNSRGHDCRAASRHWLGGGWRYYDVGVRVVLAPRGK